MSSVLNGLLTKEHSKRVHELLRPSSPQNIARPCIGVYVKTLADDDEEDCVDSQYLRVCNGARVGSKTHKGGQAQTKADAAPCQQAAGHKVAGTEEDAWDWVRDFIAQQEEDLRPIVVHGSSGGFTHTHVSIKGARHEQQDAAFSDGQLFSVFDGHGGTWAAECASRELARHFYSVQANLSSEVVGLGGVPTLEEDDGGAVEALGRVRSLSENSLSELSAATACPGIVRALHCAYMNTQRTLVSSESVLHKSGCTGVTCWIEPLTARGAESGMTGEGHEETAKGGVQVKVYVACVGDSLACLFDCESGRLGRSNFRVWDEEMGTLHSDGMSLGTTEMECVTCAHQVTGMLRFDERGAAVGMHNDPKGVGFREWKLLYKKHKFTLNSEFRLSEIQLQRSTSSHSDVDPHPAPPSWHRAASPSQGPSEGDRESWDEDQIGQRQRSLSLTRESASPAASRMLGRAWLHQGSFGGSTKSCRAKGGSWGNILDVLPRAGSEEELARAASPFDALQPQRPLAPGGTSGGVDVAAHTFASETTSFVSAGAAKSTSEMPTPSPSRSPTGFDVEGRPATPTSAEDRAKAMLGKLLPRAVSNMAGEERWRVLDIEPTRALGHAHTSSPGSRSLAPNRRPEIVEWLVGDKSTTLLLVCSDGFFSKNAFSSVQRVTEFLVDPDAYCRRPDFFQDTCLYAALSEQTQGQTHLPDPTKCSMAELFEEIYEVVLPSLNDDTWSDAYFSAFMYLTVFARESPRPTVRSQPAKTLLAACYLAVLMLSDDNVSCTLVELDKYKSFSALGPG